MRANRTTYDGEIFPNELDETESPEDKQRADARQQLADHTANAWRAQSAPAFSVDPFDRARPYLDSARADVGLNTSGDLGDRIETAKRRLMEHTANAWRVSGVRP